MLSLMCPAQGSPIPSFRLVRGTSIEAVLFFCFRTNWWIKTQVFTEVREPHLHGTVRGSACFAVPSPGITHSIIQVRRGKKNCFAFPFSIEPIGGAKPKFSQKAESLTFTENAGAQLALLCPAQGSPIPSFRFGTSSSLFFHHQNLLEDQSQNSHKNLRALLLPNLREENWLFCVQLKDHPFRHIG